MKIPINRFTGIVVSLVFVTGLAGHAFGSWKARGEHTMWVRDFLVKDLEYRHPGKTRVLTYGYDTRLLASSSTAGIDEFACSLLDAVKNARRFRNVFRLRRCVLED
jgi:hypothetical protein